MSEEKKHDCGCGCGQDHEHEHNHDCGCGHDHDHDHDCDCSCGEAITLTLDTGEELVCNLLGVFDAEDKSYAALLPMDSEEVIILRHIEGPDGSELEPIEDDAEYEAVVAVFEEIFVDDEEDEEE